MTSLYMANIPGRSFRDAASITVAIAGLSRQMPRGGASYILPSGSAVHLADLSCTMTDHDHGHDHYHDDGHEHEHEHSTLSPLELRVRALETVLTQKGYVDPAALDVLIDTYQTKIGPRNGAQVVARAWRDAEYRRRLLEDTTAAIASLGFSG